MVTLRTYLLRGLLTALFWAAAIGGFASDQEEAFLGISERYPTGAPGISRAGLVAAYDMSTLTSDGSLRDFSVNGLHGRILGTRDTPGLWGSAMTFPTAADRVDLPETDAWAIDGPLSVLLWFRLDTLGLHQHIVACDDKFVVWLTGNNLLRFVDTLGDGAITREPFSTDRWYSVAGVFNGTKGTPLTPENIRVFVNGKQVAVDLVGRPSTRPTWNPGGLFERDACYIGFESHQGLANHQTLRFGGAIDEVMAFHRPVSEAEIAIHATRPR